MQVWNVLHAACWECRTQKIVKNSPSGTIAQLCLCNWGTYWQLEKSLLNSNISPHMFPQYGGHRPTNSWDLLVSLRYPSKFQRISRLGSVTARHSSSGHQPNLAASNRGRHLYSAGRPSRSALAHILVSYQLVYMICFQCLDTAGWASGRASRL